MQKRTLRINFLSDWHIGSGAGIPGSVDRQVVRDQDGLPYVPAKTLTGILRDAAEWLVDNGGDAYSQDTLKSLFGHQHQNSGGSNEEAAKEARLSIRPARIPQPLRSELTKDKELRDALFIVQPHVRISRKTGRAEDDHLFSLELVRSSVWLEAEVCVNETGEKLTEEETKLLDDAVKAVRRMGGKRRRGAGRCNLTWIDDKWTGAGTEKQASIESKESAEWYCVPLEIEALEPLQIPSETLGNTVESRDYIPGYLLLPHIARKLGDDAAPFIVKGELQVSNLTPQIGNKPGLPVPMCLFKPKVTAKDKMTLNRALKCPPPGEAQLRGLREGYITMDEPGGQDKKTFALTYFKADDSHTLRMHSTIQDDVQRPTEEVGGVYSYMAVKKGSKFRGELRLSKTAFTAMKSKTLDGELSLGRSKKDDYGRARLSIDVCKAMQQNSITLHQGDKLVVYLESDVLVRDENLAYSADPRDLLKAIEKEVPQIGLSQEPKASGDIPAVGRARRHDNWQTSWHLPRPSLTALRAGGVYVFRVAGTWDDDALEKLALRGIGERRAEGFGRIQFNPPWLLQEEYELSEKLLSSDPGKADMTAGEISEEQQKLLDQLELNKWRRKLRRFARQKAYEMAGLVQASNGGKTGKANYFGAGSGPDKPTQWGSLRQAAARIDDDYEKGKEQLFAWVDARKIAGATPDQKDPWPSKRAEKWTKNGDVRTKIVALADNKNTIWGYFTEKPEKKEIKDKLWGFATRTLLDYVCEAALDKLRQDAAPKEEEAPAKVKG